MHAYLSTSKEINAYLCTHITIRDINNHTAIFLNNIKFEHKNKFKI